MKIVLGQKTVPVPGERSELLPTIERGHDLAAMGSLGPSPVALTPANSSSPFSEVVREGAQGPSGPTRPTAPTTRRNAKILKRARPEGSGRKVSCPSCGHAFPVPE